MVYTLYLTTVIAYSNSTKLKIIPAWIPHISSNCTLVWIHRNLTSWIWKQKLKEKPCEILTCVQVQGVIWKLLDHMTVCLDWGQIGHFQIPLCVFFNASLSLSAKPFLWKWLWFQWKWNCMWNSFSYERFQTYMWTHFEIEAQENLGMAYCREWLERCSL